MQVLIPFSVDDSKIRMERARLKISQKTLADRVKISRERINLIENARCKTLKYELLEKIANALDVTIQDLLKKDGDNV